MSRPSSSTRFAIYFCRSALLMFALTSCAYAGGPKDVAGSTGFNPAALGQPLRWPGGQVGYYVDRGALSAMVSNQQATALVDTAAAIWNAVPTAGVSLSNKGSLNEDVSAANILVNQMGQIVAPSDITPAASNYPVAVLFDYDGAIIDAIYGPTASDPGACHENGVFVWLDNFQPDATFAHGVILLNGRCATSSDLLTMMSFQVERAFGRILGLDSSQVNPGAAKSGVAGGMLGWPVMQPISGACGASGGECIPNPAVLRYDDIAALSRLYPITTANLAQFPGKQITAANTISIRGKVNFPNGYGMQGVNVVARPVDTQGNPLYQYTVTAVSGALFNGKHGNPITGWTDAEGELLTNWGSNDADLQGTFDLSGILLPPGVTSASYQVSFEAIDPLYILSNSVGPYTDGQVNPSGNLNSVTLPNLSLGSQEDITVVSTDSANGGFSDAIAPDSQPRQLPTTGFWYGRLSQVGQTDWFTFPVRGNRTFTVVTQSLDEAGNPTGAKALPSIGIWDAFDSVDAPAVGAVPGLNGLAAGETWLRVTASGDDLVRIAIADLRGDGRPDYTYSGWALYADSVEPTHLSASGGPIVIHGMGFRADDTVMVNGQPALVTSVSPNEITVIAPAAAQGVSGSVDIEVDDAPIFYASAVIHGGLSYDAGKGDALKLVTAPANTVPLQMPLPFSVTALDASLNPVGGVTVLYTITGGTAKLGCGLSTCAATTSGDGQVTINVTATNGAPAIVTASLTNGANVRAQFSGGTPATLTALTPQLSVAAGATVVWTVQALALTNGTPAANQSVVFQSGNGIATSGSATLTTNASGIATAILTVGPLAKAQEASIKACINGTSQCVTFSAFGARPEYAWLQPVSGTAQTLDSAATPTGIVLRLLDMNGNVMAGGSVQLYQSLYAWTPPCLPHVPCKNGTLLATQSATATSGIDGIVTFAPASIPGVATRLQALAVSGNASSVSIAIEQH